MEEYTFTSNIYSIVGMDENDVLIFLKDGNTRRFSMDDYSVSFDYTNPEYYQVKHSMDDFVYQYIQDSPTITSHLLYGYVFKQYDNDYFLNLCRTDTSFFGLVGNSVQTPTRNFYISGLRMNYPYGDSYYLGMFDGVAVGYNTQAIDGFSADIRYDYVNSRYTNQFFFDYRLSNDESMYKPVVDGIPSDINQFDSYFEFSRTQNENYTIRFGYKPFTDYNKGFNDGLQQGLDSGREQGIAIGQEQGYQTGYYDGLAKGGNLPASGFSMVGNAIESLTPIFGLEVLPNISLGTVISIPIIVTILTIIFRISKG